jgi:hypothetical protein
MERNRWTLHNLCLIAAIALHFGVAAGVVALYRPPAASPQPGAAACLRLALAVPAAVTR